MKRIIKRLETFFKIKERGTTIFGEIIAGVIVFFAILYAIPVNVSILGITGMSDAAIFTTIAIASGIATLLLGIITNYPIVLSAGLGMNAFFAFTIYDKLKYTWQEGLTIILISSFVFFILSISGLRRKIINAIPHDLKYAISSGLGFFIAFIGLKMGGIIESSPSSLVKLGDLSNPVVLLALFGIVLAFSLSSLKSRVNKFAIVISMVITAAVGYFLHLLGVPNMPAFAVDSKITLAETAGVAYFNFPAVLANPKTYAIIFSVVFVQLFDATATLVAVGHDIGLIDQSGKINSKSKVMVVDSLGALIGNSLGATSVTPLAETTIGIDNGAKTGLTSVVIGILFILTLVAYPVFSIFSSIKINNDYFTPVTSMALVSVGALLFSNVQHINWQDKIAVTTTFMIIIMMVLTSSISEGLGIGLIFYCIMMLVAKRGKEINPILYGISLFYILSFAVDILVMRI